MKVNAIALMAFVLIAWRSEAQINLLYKTIVWNSNESIDLYSGISLHYKTTITTTASSLVLKNDEATMTFPISNIQGSWANPAEDGWITFDMPVSKGTGKASIQRLRGEITLIIDFSDRKDGKKRKFLIQNLSIK